MLAFSREMAYNRSCRCSGEVATYVNMDTSEVIMNFFNKKTQVIIVRIIAIALVLLMVVALFAAML